MVLVRTLLALAVCGMAAVGCSHDAPSGLPVATRIATLDDVNSSERGYVDALALSPDAGFVATGALAPSRRAELAGTIDPNRRNLHRTVAIASMSTALAGYVMMLFWKS